jgi:hypothetical protein
MDRRRSDTGQTILVSTAENKLYVRRVTNDLRSDLLDWQGDHAGGRRQTIVNRHAHRQAAIAQGRKSQWVPPTGVRRGGAQERDARGAPQSGQSIDSHRTAGGEQAE